MVLLKKSGFIAKYLLFKKVDCWITEDLTLNYQVINDNPLLNYLITWSVRRKRKITRKSPLNLESIACISVHEICHVCMYVAMYYKISC